MQENNQTRSIINYENTKQNESTKINSNKIRGFIVVIGGFFLLFDQFIKWQATHSWGQIKFISKYFGWQPFLNSGAAFSLPLPNWLVIILSFPIIALVIFLLIKERQKTYNFLIWTLILSGAISNFLDRLFYGHVVDYLTFFTGVINLGDILIVIGLILYLLKWKKFQSKAG